MNLQDYLSRCEGLGCPFKDKCKRYSLHLKDREQLKYAIHIIPHFTDKVCLDIIKIN
jgi:hypothetical protein